MIPASRLKKGILPTDKPSDLTYQFLKDAYSLPSLRDNLGTADSSYASVPYGTILVFAPPNKNIFKHYYDSYVDAFFFLRILSPEDIRHHTTMRPYPASAMNPFGTHFVVMPCKEDDEDDDYLSEEELFLRDMKYIGDEAHFFQPLSRFGRDYLRILDPKDYHRFTKYVDDPSFFGAQMFQTLPRLSL